MYYSSTDRTTAIAPTYQGQGNADQGGPTASQPQTQTDEAANPDYNYNTNGAGAAINSNGSSAQYYDNAYDRATTTGTTTAATALLLCPWRSILRAANLFALYHAQLRLGRRLLWIFPLQFGLLQPLLQSLWLRFGC